MGVPPDGTDGGIVGDASRDGSRPDAPNVNFIGISLQVDQLDPFELAKHTGQYVIDPTCNQPASGMDYSVPSGVTVERIPGGDFQVVTVMMRSAAEYAATASSTVKLAIGTKGSGDDDGDDDDGDGGDGGDGSAHPIAGTATGRFDSFRQSSVATEQREFIGLAYQERFTYRGYLSDDWFGAVPHAHFVESVAALPTSYASAADQQAYSTFIDRFGTHFVREATMGGRSLLWTKVDDSSFVSMVKSNVDLHLGLKGSYLELTGQTEAGTSDSSTTTFTRETDVDIQNLRYLGGDETNWSTWSSSVDDDPYPIGAVLAEISEALDPRLLTSQPAADLATRRGNLERALADRLATMPCLDQASVEIVANIGNVVPVFAWRPTFGAYGDFDPSDWRPPAQTGPDMEQQEWIKNQIRLSASPPPYFKVQLQQTDFNPNDGPYLLSTASFNWEIVDLAFFAFERDAQGTTPVTEFYQHTVLNNANLEGAARAYSYACTAQRSQWFTSGVTDFNAWTAPCLLTAPVHELAPPKNWWRAYTTGGPIPSSYGFDVPAWRDDGTQPFLVLGHRL